MNAATDGGVTSGNSYFCTQNRTLSFFDDLRAIWRNARGDIGIRMYSRYGVVYYTMQLTPEYQTMTNELASSRTSLRSRSVLCGIEEASCTATYRHRVEHGRAGKPMDRPLQCMELWQAMKPNKLPQQALLWRPSQPRGRDGGCRGDRGLQDQRSNERACGRVASGTV